MFHWVIVNFCLVELALFILCTAFNEQNQLESAIAVFLAYYTYARDPTCAAVPVGVRRYNTTRLPH